MLGTRPEAFRLCRRLRHGRLDFVFADKADIAHGLKNDLRTLLRRLRITRRRQAGRRFQQAGEKSGFAKIDVAGGFVEVPARCCLNPVSIRTEIDAVQIHRKDLVLGVFLLQPEGEQHLLDFPL